MTHPITIDAARLTWDGRTPTGTELRAWLESLPGSEFATGLLILADALDREPTRPEPADIRADLDELADCTFELTALVDAADERDRIEELATNAGYLIDGFDGLQVGAVLADDILRVLDGADS